MPRLNIQEEAFARIGDPLSDDEIDLKSEDIDYSNLELSPEEQSRKPKLKNSSVAEMRELFDPDEDIVRKKVNDKFYVFNPSIDAEEAEKRLKYRIKPSKDSNYFDLRVGDTVQLFGDTSTSYRISYIYRDKGQVLLRFDLENNKKIDGERFDLAIKPSDVSAVISREWGSKIRKKGDYYLSNEWLKRVKMHEAKDSRTSRIYSSLGLSKKELERLLDPSKPGGYTALLLYAVPNGSTSIYDPIEGNSFDEVTSNRFVATDPAKALEYIEMLKDVDDTNGIVVVGLSAKSFADYGGANMEAKINILKSVKDEWVRAYISLTKDPIFIETPKNKTKDSKKKLNADSLLGKASAVLATFTTGTKQELIDLLDAEVSVDSVEGLKEFKPGSWFKYKDGDKWHVFPKMKLINTLEEANKAAIFDTVSIVKLEDGKHYTIVGNEGVKVKDVIYEEESSDDDYYVFINDGSPEKIKKDQLHLLWGLGYKESESTSPATAPTPTPAPAPAPAPVPTAAVDTKSWIDRVFVGVKDEQKDDIYTNMTVNANAISTNFGTEKYPIGEVLSDIQAIIDRMLIIKNDLPIEDLISVIDNMGEYISIYKNSQAARSLLDRDSILAQMITLDSEQEINYNELTNSEECT
jgi:hypothetical protein